VKDTTAAYDAVKEFEGRKYTGMRVGGSHSWYYGEGEWEETKVDPDKWQFSYAVKKRRKWDAPEGSGAATGTEYNWYILARQIVKKVNANEYTTSMTGAKYKLAHRRAGREEWSASERAQLKKLIVILEENVAQLRHELGDVRLNSGAMRSEADSSGVTCQRRKEAVGGRRVPPKSLILDMLGQQPLEMYIPHTAAAGADASASSSGSRPSLSSKSEFLPKNSR